MSIKLIAKIVSVFTGLFFSTLLHSALIHNDDFGYTADTESSLDWRDMRITDGFSYDEVVTKMGSGNLVGWRFATSAEFDTLMLHSNGGPYVEGSSNSTFTAMESLIGLFGSTYAENSFAYAVGFVDSAGQSVAHARQFGYLAYADPSLSEGYIRPDSETTWDKDFDESHQFVGSFVVRTSSVVPVPAAVWLFGSGLIGLVGFARRKQV